MLDKKLEIFRMAATLKHFSAAAAALGMTQPNVTQQIARLEDELGTPLFERGGRTMTLLPAGEALLLECDRLFAETGEIRRRVLNAAERFRHYRLGGTMTAGGYVLPDYAALYMQEYPRHHLGLRIANTSVIAEQLKTRTLDLALVEGPFDQNFFLYEDFMEDELIPVAAPGVLPEKFSMGDYLRSGGRFVLRESGSGTRFYFDRFLKQMKWDSPAEEQVFEVDSFDALKLLVRGRYGITVISRLAVADELRAGSIVASELTEGRILRPFRFIYLPNENQSFVENFISFCRRTKRNKGNLEKEIQ